MRINENTDVNAFYLFPTRYGLKLASNDEENLISRGLGSKIIVQAKRIFESRVGHFKSNFL